MDDKKWIGDWIDENAGIFTEVNDRIWDYAELAFHEYRSAELLEDMLGKAGFKVKKGIAGIPTAFTAEASVGSGKPVMGILGEYDALSGLSQEAGITKKKPREGCPNTGHGCGHCSLGTGSLAAAMAIKAWL